MTEAQAIEAILQHWEDQWELLHPADPEDPDHVPWTTDNEVFETVPAWVRIAIVPSSSRQASMGPAGSRRWARRGTIGVQLFARPQEGMGAIAALADDVRTCLEGARISTPGVDEPVCVYEGSSGSPQTDGVWQMLLVALPFRFDQHR